MLKQVLCVMLLMITGNVIAQPFRIHLMGGFANYTGDIQQKRVTFDQARGVVAAGPLLT